MPDAATQEAPRTVDEPGMGRLEIWNLATDEPSLEALLRDVFDNWWQGIFFGILIQGAAWEIAAPNAPRKISMMDGYMTVDFGPWHFHLCIGETRGTPRTPTPPELAKHRRTHRAELYRELQAKKGNEGAGTPNSWGLRLFNGQDEQQLTVFLPNPFLTDEMQVQNPPDFSRLAMWDHLRERYLGLPPDPRDREGKGFVHG